MNNQSNHQGSLSKGYKSVNIKFKPYFTRRNNEISRERTMDFYIIGDLAVNTEVMNNNCNQAKIIFALKVIDGLFYKFVDLEFKYLESVWLLEIKQLKAYFIWNFNNQRSDLDNYHKGCDDIRNKLLNGDRTDLKYFSPVEKYIRDHYLNAKDQLDTNSDYVKGQISMKAYLIYEITKRENEKNNWYIAELYTKMFYENIISAVKKSDNESTIKILKALQFDKSRDNCYSVITAFETAIAIHFLDKTLLRIILKKWDHGITV